MKLLRLPLSLELASAMLLRRNCRKFKDSPMFAAFIGITLSIIPFVLVVEVSDSMISGIMNRYIETFYSHIILRFYNSSAKQEIQDLQRRILQLENVRMTYKERSGVALLIARKSRTPVQIRALEAQAFTEDQGLQRYLKVISGAWELSSGSILLANDVAFKLGIQVGDEVTLLMGARFGRSQQLRPKIEKFLVRGIVSTGYQELDHLWAFISYNDATSFFHDSNSELQLHIKIADAFDFGLLNQTLRQVQSLISSGLARARSWYNQAAELRQSYQFTKSILVYIMYLIVAVGTVNITSSMVMLVLENRAEIAIMKTFGANKALIRNIYIWIAILVSVVAIFCGVSLGILISYFINEIILVINTSIQVIANLCNNVDNQLDLLDKSFYLERIPIRLQILPLILISVFVLLLSFIFSLMPALRAANMLPLTILRQNRS